MALATETFHIKNLSFPVLSSRDQSVATTLSDLTAKLIAIITFIRQDDLIPDITKKHAHGFELIVGRESVSR